MSMPYRCECSSVIACTDPEMQHCAERSPTAAGSLRALTALIHSNASMLPAVTQPVQCMQVPHACMCGACRSPVLSCSVAGRCSTQLRADPQRRAAAEQQLYIAHTN